MGLQEEVVDLAVQVNRNGYGPALGYVREHPDAALHRGFLARHQPVAVVNSEHALQELHKDRLAGLQSGALV